MKYLSLVDLKDEVNKGNAKHYQEDIAKWAIDIALALCLIGYVIINALM